MIKITAYDICQWMNITVYDTRTGNVLKAHRWYQIVAYPVSLLRSLRGCGKVVLGNILSIRKKFIDLLGEDFVHHDPAGFISICPK